MIKQPIMNERLRLFESEHFEALCGQRDRDGIPWWFLTRDTILKGISDRLTHKGNSIPARSGVANALLFNAKASLHYAKAKGTTKKAHYLFFTPSRYYQTKNGTINTFCEQIASELNAPFTIFENAPVDWTWRIDRARSNIICYAPVYSAGRVMGRLSAQHPEKSYTAFSTCVINVIEQSFGPLLTLQEVKALLNLAYERTIAANVLSTELVNRLGAKTEIVFCVGSFYSENAKLVTNIKKTGRTIVELQHGVFFESNFILNPANGLIAMEGFDAGKPDFFLTYGTFWNGQTNLPSVKVAIGSPFRDLRLSELKKGEDKNKIIVLGTSRQTKEYLELTSAIQQLDLGYQVLFRPHPVERATAEALIGKGLKVELDVSDLYESLSQAYMVIGETTTALYEAIGLAHRIVSWRTDYAKSEMPLCPFEELEDISHVADLFKPHSRTALYANEFWQEGWRTNFSRFMDTLTH